MLPPQPELPGLAFIAQPENAGTAVAFVHGLGGHCYETWGPNRHPATFITRLSTDFPGVAVASFGYSSGWRRALDADRLKVEELARIWKDTLRDSLLASYRAVAIVCHSLGGVVTMTALRLLLTNEAEWVRRLREREWSLALFLLGVPQHGTTTGGTGWASDELEVLTYNESLVRANTEFWQSRVRQPEEAVGEGQIPIFCFAVVSEIDNWVPQLSAGANLPQSHVRHVALSHSDLVKPLPEGEHVPYAFVLGRLRQSLGGLGLSRDLRARLARFEAGRDMVFDRVDLDRVVPRPWLDSSIARAARRRRSGFVHLEAQAGAGKSAYLARFLDDRDLPGFFFDASQGITGAAELHEALWVQLVARGLLPAGEPPERLGTDSRVLRGLLAEAAAKSAGPLTVVVDALDEAQPEGASPALLPVLPDGVTFVTSSRPEAAAPAGAIRITIDVDAEESHADVRRFVERRSTDDDVLAVLVNEGWSADRLIEEVSERAGGLFAYAHFVLADLATGQLRLADLERFSQGLDEYYAFTWERWQRTHRNRFHSVLKPVLAGVAMARAPVSAAMVAAWTDLEPVAVDEALRCDLRPWVTPTSSGDEHRYRLYHQSVRDFLWQKAPAIMRQVRTKSAAHLLSLTQAESPPVGEAVDYSIEHVVWHLIHDGQHRLAAALLLDLVYLSRHRERAGNSTILAELLALQEHSRGRADGFPVGRLLHAWNDEAFAVEQVSHLLSQFSYRIEADPVLRRYLSESFEALAGDFTGSWLRCVNAVTPRSTPSLTLRGHEGSVFQFAMSWKHRRLVSAGADGTLRVWSLDAPGDDSRLLQGHKGPVLCCALTSDGQRLVSASEDATLRVWNLALTKKGSQLLQGHAGPVLHLAISRDDRRVVSASSDATLRVWDLTSPGREPRVLAGHESEVNHCELTSDGARLVSASDDKTLRVWNLEATECERVLRGHEAAVLHCALSLGDRRVVSASTDRTLRLWDLESPRSAPRVLQGHDGGVNYCTAGPGRHHVISASDDGTLRVWDLDSPSTESTVLRGHKRPVVSLALSRTGRRLVSASVDGTLRVWDLRSPEEVPRVLRGHEDSISYCELSEDDEQLVSASDDGTLRVWDLTSPDEDSPAVRGHDEAVRFCLLSTDDRWLVSASDDETLRVWNVGSPGEEPRALRGHEGPVTHCAWIGNRSLVSASDDGTLRIWDLRSAETLHSLRGHTGAVNYCAVTSDGRRLVSASDDATLRLWDLEAPAEPRVIRGHKGGVNHFALSRDGRRLVSASADATLRVWNLEAPDEEPQVLRGHQDWVRHCALSPDGQRLVSASDDGTLRVWSLDTPDQEPQVLHGHEDWIRTCEFTSDGCFVVSASDDATVRVWHVEATSRPPRVLRGHQGGILGFDLALGDQRLASASSDGTIRVWDLASGATLARFRAVSDVNWVGWAGDGCKLFAGDGSGRVWTFEFVAGQPAPFRA